jgi:DNA-binding MarR family transcriptional regulator
MRLLRRPAQRREKVFGEGRAIPLDRNAKARIWAYAVGYTARLRQDGQHRGPLTRAYLDVLRALLWSFHNQHTGRCFPSYESLAEKAQVSRATVARAIDALEAAGVLTWANRLVRQRVAVDGLLGRTWLYVPRRTSNAYQFRDPQQVSLPLSPKSQKQTGTTNQDFSLPVAAKIDDLDPKNGLHAALLRLRDAMALNPIEQAERA